MSDGAGTGLVERARSAAGAGDWPQAFELLMAADADGLLPPAELPMLGDPGPVHLNVQLDDPLVPDDTWVPTAEPGIPPGHVREAVLEVIGAALGTFDGLRHHTETGDDRTRVLVGQCRHLPAELQCVGQAHEVVVLRDNRLSGALPPQRGRQLRAGRVMGAHEHHPLTGIQRRRRQGGQRLRVQLQIGATAVAFLALLGTGAVLVLLCSLRLARGFARG